MKNLKPSGPYIPGQTAWDAALQWDQADVVARVEELESEAANLTVSVQCFGLTPVPEPTFTDDLLVRAEELEMWVATLKVQRRLAVAPKPAAKPAPAPALKQPAVKAAAQEKDWSKMTATEKCEAVRAGRKMPTGPTGLTKKILAARAAKP
jgi:hypothetical protein